MSVLAKCESPTAWPFSQMGLSSDPIFSALSSALCHCPVSLPSLPFVAELIVLGCFYLSGEGG